jgi:hypothetical protein
LSFLHPLSADSDGSSSVDAIMTVVKKRKAQLQKQQESVLQANEDAERINLLSLSKRKAD